MPTVTALRADRRGRVRVELDGTAWRTVPEEVAAQAGLREGRVLDRPALRVLRRELRRSEALAIATRALRARDLSKQQISERLQRAAIDPKTRRESIATLTRAGFLDDRRVAGARARSLADRGYGDAAIRHDLERKGVTKELVDASLEELEPEAERVSRVVQRRGQSPSTARYLAGKGFSGEAVEAVLGARFANDP
jgi:regulatory protein